MGALYSNICRRHNIQERGNKKEFTWVVDIWPISSYEENFIKPKRMMNPPEKLSDNTRAQRT